MTITAQTAKSGPYNGNGSTVTFSYAFRVDDQDDLVVTLRAADGIETVQTITTHYTVAGVGEASGGTITMVTAPATGEQLVITRTVGLTQEVDLQNRGSVDPETLERAYDKLTQIAQDQQQQIDRAVKTDLFDATASEGLVANINALAAIEGSITTVAGDIADVSTVAGDIADVSAVATNIADVTNFADVYVGPSASDPATRTDGSALQTGDLYFNTTDGRLRVYDGGWQLAAFDMAGALYAANNLSELTDVETALQNLNHPDQLSRLPIKADAAINKGAVVYATGAVGSSGRLTVDNYIADGSITEVYIIGIADRALATNDEGYAIAFGELQNVSTDGSTAFGSETWTAGTVLYADPDNAGYLTNVEPTYPDVVTPVAMVLVAHASNGILFARPNIDEDMPTFSQATWEAGTETTEALVSPAKVSAAIATLGPQVSRSTAAGISDGGLTTFAHGLGAVPDLVQVQLTCTSGEGGFAIGDQIVIVPSSEIDGSNEGFSLRIDATNVYIRIGGNGPGQYTRKDNGAGFTLTSFRWDMTILAFTF